MSDNKSELSDKFELELLRAKENIFSGVLASYTRSYDAWKRIQGVIKYFIQEIKKRKNTIKVLDAGCGDGRLTCLFNSIERVKEKVVFYGIDISPTEIHFGKSLANFLQMNNLNFDIGNVTSLRFSGASFDIVMCLDVIEHLEEPAKCLSEVFRVLKPGGLGIVTTCNKTSPFRRLGRLFKHKLAEEKTIEEKENLIRGFPGHGHISVKGLYEWLDMVKEQGFIVEGIKRTNIFFGGPRYDKHPILFAFILVIDNILLDHFPFMKNFSERFVLKMRKPG